MQPTTDNNRELYSSVEQLMWPTLRLVRAIDLMLDPMTHLCSGG